MYVTEALSLTNTEKVKQANEINNFLINIHRILNLMFI